MKGIGCTALTRAGCGGTPFCACTGCPKRFRNRSRKMGNTSVSRTVSATLAGLQLSRKLNECVYGCAWDRSPPVAPSDLNRSRTGVPALLGERYLSGFSSDFRLWHPERPNYTTNFRFRSQQPNNIYYFGASSASLFSLAGPTARHIVPCAPTRVPRLLTTAFPSVLSDTPPSPLDSGSISRVSHGLGD